MYCPWQLYMSRQIGESWAIFGEMRKLLNLPSAYNNRSGNTSFGDASGLMDSTHDRDYVSCDISVLVIVSVISTVERFSVS